MWALIKWYQLVFCARAAGSKCRTCYVKPTKRGRISMYTDESGHFTILHNSPDYISHSPGVWHDDNMSTSCWDHMNVVTWKFPKKKPLKLNFTIWEPIRQEADSSQWLKCWDDGCKFMLIESQDYVRTLFASPHMLTNNHKQTFNYGPTILKEHKRVKSSFHSSWVQTGVDLIQYISPNHRFISNTASKYSQRV